MSDQHIHASARDLRRYIGGRARLWHFAPTHDRLVIELTTSDGQAAFLVLTGCAQLTLPTMWIPRRVEVRASSANARAPIEFVDTDVRVDCEGAVLQAQYSS
jgi:hypothetical protein